MCCNSQLQQNTTEMMAYRVMWREQTCLFPGMGAFLWQITAMAPSAPISRVMSHSKELVGVAVRKVTPFFTVALWTSQKWKRSRMCVTTSEIWGNGWLFFQSLHHVTHSWNIFIQSLWASWFPHTIYLIYSSRQPGYNTKSAIRDVTHVTWSRVSIRHIRALNNIKNMIYFHLYPTVLTPLGILNSTESIGLSVHPRVCAHYLNWTNGSLLFLASNL